MMSSDPCYVPVLRCKKAEMEALLSLREEDSTAGICRALSTSSIWKTLESQGCEADG